MHYNVLFRKQPTVFIIYYTVCFFMVINWLLNCMFLLWILRQLWKTVEGPVAVNPRHLQQHLARHP